MKVTEPVFAPRSSKMRVGQLTHHQRSLMYHFLTDGEKGFFGIRPTSEVREKFPAITIRILLTAGILKERKSTQRGRRAAGASADGKEMFLTGHGKRLLLALDYMRCLRQIRG